MFRWWQNLTPGNLTFAWILLIFYFQCNIIIIFLRKSKLSSKEIWMISSGIHWISGIWAILKCTLYGGKIVITTRPTLTTETFAKYNVTTIIVTPPLLATLFHSESNPVTSVKILIVGGLATSTNMSAKAKLLFPNAEICHTYGSSEGGMLAVNFTNSKLESVGHLYGNIEMKVILCSCISSQKTKIS